MHDAWQPIYRIGDAVSIVRRGVKGIVIEVDDSQRAYVIEVNGNPDFRLLCTQNELRRWADSA